MFNARQIESFWAFSYLCLCGNKYWNWVWNGRKMKMKRWEMRETSEALEIGKKQFIQFILIFYWWMTINFWSVWLRLSTAALSSSFFALISSHFEEPSSHLLIMIDCLHKKKIQHYTLTLKCRNSLKHIVKTCLTRKKRNNKNNIFETFLSTYRTAFP